MGELRRIFDNLISNIQKYAEPAEPVVLTVSKTDGDIVITQSNAMKQSQEPTESYKLGLNSIRRIAQNYGGSVEISQTEEVFNIVITLSNI